MRKVTFRCNAPYANRVAVAGSFNNWDSRRNPMHRRTNGDWGAELSLPPGRYEYCFVVDSQWMRDPTAAEAVPNPYGGRNSVRVVSANANNSR